MNAIKRWFKIAWESFVEARTEAAKAYITGRDL